VVAIVVDNLPGTAALEQTRDLGYKEQTVWVVAVVAHVDKLGLVDCLHWCFCMIDSGWISNCCTLCCRHLGSEHS